MNNTTILMNVSGSQESSFQSNIFNSNNETKLMNMKEPEMQLEEFVYRYIGPVFMVVGIIGNLLTCIVLRKSPLNNLSVSIYLFAYGVAAILTLASLGIDWFSHMFEFVHFKHMSEGGCRIWEFTNRITIYSGVWFITGGAIDRFIALWMPYKSQEMCTVFIAKASVAFILTGVTVVSIHALWLYSFVPFVHYGCQLNSSTDFSKVWFWASQMLFFTLLPQILLFLFGNLLIVRLCLKHRGRQIPETVAIEMDLTNTVMILAMLYFFLSFPATIVMYIDVSNPMLRYHPELGEQIMNAMYFTNYLIWICYSCPIFILIGCSKAFREVLKQTFLSCILFIRTGSTSADMAVLVENYEQVPTTSTSL